MSQDEIEDFLGTALVDLQERVLRTPTDPLTSFLEVE
jgi:tRNA nucleotidyltransferase/poly(A) polymerase